MGLNTKTSIIISGKEEINEFNSLSLHQEIGAHHHLEIAFRMDDFEKKITTPNALFGDKISIKIADTNDEGKELKFVGYITQIKRTKTDGGAGSDQIIIIAKSPTIFADDGPNYRAFIDEKPSDIVKKVLKGYSIIKSSVRDYPHKLSYSVQHNESSFDFVCRLAAQYGQWCYYDGTDKVVFGNPTDSGTPVELKYPIDLKEFSLSQLPHPTNFEYVSYDVNTKESDPYKAANKGEEVLKSGMLNDQTSVLFNQASGNAEALLKDVAESQGKSLAINQIQLTGVSTNPELLLGGLIKPTSAAEGTYRIIKISHSCNELGSYENRFAAVASTFDTYPYTNIRAYPQSQNQIGIVEQTDEDPEGLGRIKVSLFYHDEAVWMRMITPHAGDDRGIFFLPEVDDEVLVGFEGSNAEHPYVMGCLYNGIDKPPLEADLSNTIKTIKTRSGLKIEFDDEKRSFTVETPGLNKFTMDDDSQIIEIEDEHGNKVTMDSQGITFDSASDITMKAQGDITMEGVNIEQKAQVSFKAEGSASAEISASGQTTVKGAMVMIN